MGKIKIYCHTCDGDRFITEKKYPSGQDIQVPCPECNGDGWVTVER